MTIRISNANDAEAAAPFLRAAFEGGWPAATSEVLSYTSRLQALFALPGNRFSYEYSLVYEREKEIIGLILSFAGSNEDYINQTSETQMASLGSGSVFHLTREAEPDEWCIEALAVSPPQTRQGIGTQLLKAAEQLALLNGYKKCSLRVEQENMAALRLYQHQGYTILKEVEYYHHHYFHMLKQLSQSKEK